MKKLLLSYITFTLLFTIQAKLDEQKALNYDSWIRTLGEVINLFETKYYQDMPPKETMAQALKAFAEQDPHSTFLGPDQCKKLQEQMSGEFFGIGIVLPGDKKKDEEFFPIIETVPGGPADKAGLKAGDKVIQVDDNTIKGLDIDTIMSKLKGPKNSKVTVKVLRANYPEPLNFDIIRDVVKDEMALAYYLPKYRVHYLLLSIFGEKSAQHVEEVIKKALTNNSNGIILDLRNNTGGLFDSAIAIAGLFLPKNTPLVSIKERNHKVVSEWKTTREPLKIPASMPIFILVNNYTASASEILAGSLQIYAHKKNLTNTFIIGDETFGKGSVQEVIPVSNESALKITTGLYYLPYDTCIQGKGVTPDFEIEYRTPPTDAMKWVTTNYGKEKALKGTINPHGNQDNKQDDTNTKKDDKDKPWKERRKEILAKDYFIQNAINLIELYHLGRSCHPGNFLTHESALQFLKTHYAIDATVEVQELKI